MKSRPPVPVACTMDRAPPAGRQIPLMTRGQSTPESDRQAGLSTIVTETGAGDIFTVNSNHVALVRFTRWVLLQGDRVTRSARQDRCQAVPLGSAALDRCVG